MMLLVCMHGDGLLFPKELGAAGGKCLFCCFVSSVLSKGGLEYACMPNKSSFPFLYFFYKFELELAEVP